MHGTKVDIRRVVPGVWHKTGDWHASSCTEEQAAAPVAEVGKSDYALAANAQHFFQHSIRVMDSLQSVGEHYGIKALVGEVCQAFIHILFDNIQATSDSAVDIGLVDFDPRATHLSLITESLQEFTVSTAQVQHP